MPSVFPHLITAYVAFSMLDESLIRTKTRINKYQFTYLSNRIS